jgi:GDP-mannose 6-dehydrogenase
MDKSERSVSVFGLGYVGSVTAACLAHQGNRVIGVDTDVAKADAVESGCSPIIEARMDELVTEGRSSCHLHGTTDSKLAVRNSEISFICVGTPSLRNGSLDLRHVQHVCREIGEGLRHKETYHVVVLRSTVLPGTTESVAIPSLEAASGKRAGVDFAVCYNPEFMREGSAVADFFEPPYTILGASNPKQLKPLRDLYCWVSGRVFETSLVVAEMAKYVSNAFHALKVGFANEVGTLAKHLGVDSSAVTEIFTSDTRLNVSPAYLTPGFAFGGSCLPKDLRALTYRAKELDLQFPLLTSILPSNTEHLERAAEAVLRTGAKRVALLGLSFKAGTDDLRESPQVRLAKNLLGEGRQLRIWDEHVSLGKLTGSNRRFIEEVIPHIGSLLETDLRRVVESAEVVVIGTKSAAMEENLAGFLHPEQTVIDLVNVRKSKTLSGRVKSYEGLCW